MRYLVTRANRKSENELVTSIHDGVLSLPSRYQLPKAELAKNWFSLRRAIREAYRVDALPKALICEITKRYFKLIHSQTQVEMALTEQFKLNLTKRTERRTSSQHMKLDNSSDRNDKIMKTSG
jgi:2-polyprenyl-3-methyl-5-hydroxy-6-metoxy-1,4-benzoquinol methylase